MPVDPATDTKTSEAALEHLRSLAADLVGSASPYEVAWEIHFGAMAGTVSGPVDERQRVLNDHHHALWLLWGSLTDWVENKPNERAATEETMRRAAREWLEVVDDEVKWRLYFDRWLYDEMGYARPAAKG